MNKEIKQLMLYGLQKGLIHIEDERYIRNALLDIVGLLEYEDEEIEDTILESPQPILDRMISYAISQHIIEDTQENRDRFDTRLMNTLVPHPKEIIDAFWKAYTVRADCATDYYYEISKASNYIRMDRIKKDKKWITSTCYGELDITINLSKPEKDPKDIAKAKAVPSTKYPKCLLCKENEGYSGSASHPARYNHRIIPITLHQSLYYLQYSPYSYYPEHSILFNDQHIPMVIDANTFHSLLDFVEQFPHYFIGSNADLPIVGGSILSHDHFQGGRYTFAMEKAKMIDEFTSKHYPSITYGRVKWPLSVLRIKGTKKEDIIHFATKVLDSWRSYSDEASAIFAYTMDTPHNTITPIARQKNGVFELDLTLRNNRTSDEHPFGIFHPHANLHHIKKENIGLIEVMGLAVLPSRLLQELKTIENCILEQRPLPNELSLHASWFQHLCNTYSKLSQESLHVAIKQEVGHIFKQVLEDSGVYKQDDVGQSGFLRFIATLER